MDVKLQQVEMFRTIYALCDVLKAQDESGKHRLKASHYACVLESGRYPIWGVFSARSNKLIQLLGSRAQVEEQYPNKRWYRKAASWSLGKVQESLEYEQKQAELRKQLSKAPKAVTVEATAQTAAIPAAVVG